MQITIYDGNNWFRRRIESDRSGKAVSSCFYEIQNSPRFPIIVWDGYNHLKARKDIYPEYKGKRKPAGESIYESQNLLVECLKLGKGISIKLQDVEADDVIAYLVRKYKPQGHDLFIESNDADFMTLGVPMARETLKDIPTKWLTLYKTVVGDPSDNIPGLQGFGKGGFLKLPEEHLAILENIILSCINEPEEYIANKLEPLDLRPSVLNQLIKKEVRKQLIIFNKVVNFIYLTDEQVKNATVTNSNTSELAIPIFKEYML